MTGHQASAEYVRAFALVFAFVCLAILALAVRDAEVLTMIAAGKPVTTSDYRARAALCPHLPACFRVGDAWLGVALEKGLVAASRVLDLLPYRYRPDLLSVPVKEGVLIMFAAVLARMLGLFPILIGAGAAYRSLLLRLLFVVAVFMSVFGWARKGPLFAGQTFATYDYPAIGYLFLLFFLLQGRYLERFRNAAAALVAGQLFFENLGVAAGVAMAFHRFGLDRTSALGDRVARAGRRLVGLGAVSLGALAVLYVAISWKAGASGPAGVGVLGYFREAFETYGRHNLREFYDLSENYFILLAYPTASGIAIGLVAALGFASEGRDRNAARNQFWAAFAVWAGFMCTIAIGIFLSGLAYEMGRQLVPLACINTLMWAKGVELLAARVPSARR